MVLRGGRAGGGQAFAGWSGRGGTIAVSVCGLCAAAGLLLSGCSTEGAAAEDHAPAAAPGAAVRGGADALLKAGTSRVRTTMQTVSGGTRVAIGGRGVFDYRAGRGRLVLVLPEPSGAGAAAAKPITEVFAPGALFMKNRGAGVPADKWVRIDTTRLSDGNFVTGGATDPLSAAELLRGARDVHLVGQARWDGDRVWHYRGVAGIASAARALEASAKSPAGKGRRPGPAAASRDADVRSALLAARAGFTTDQVPFDVYLDEAGRPRVIRARFTFANGAPHGTSVTSTVRISDFGAPAEAALPDTADIYAGKVETSAP